MKKSFTLTELVVVMMICATFIAIIIPSVNAKEDALKVSCTGNLKQLYAIEQMYANDNGGYICPTTVNRKGYARNLIPYAKGNMDIFACPDAKNAPYAKKITTKNWKEIPTGKYYLERTYMRNSCIGGWEPFKAWHGKARKFEGTRKPERYVMTFDGNMSQGTWEIIRYNAKTKVSKGVEYRHDDSANVLFQDGHIAAFKPADFKGGRGIGTPDEGGNKYTFARR